MRVTPSNFPPISVIAYYTSFEPVLSCLNAEGEVAAASMVTGFSLLSVTVIASFSIFESVNAPGEVGK